jgi:CSLREA domain-containing protein
MLKLANTLATPAKALVLVAVVAIALLISPRPELARANSNIQIGTPDTAGAAFGISMELDSSDRPVVSYAIGNDVKVLRCGNTDCSSGNSITTVETLTSVPPTFTTSIALDASQNPVVSYNEGSPAELHVLHCGNTTCTSGNSIEDPDTQGRYNSLELDGSGNPIVVHSSGSSTVNVLHCNDANCAGSNESYGSFTATGTGQLFSLELDGTLPVIAYIISPSQDLEIARCNEANCTGNDESLEQPDTTGDVGAWPSLALVGSGQPVVSYYDNTNGDLQLMHCNDDFCDGGGESITPVDTTGTDVGQWTSLILDGGNPVVSYHDFDNGNLKVLRCNDANCTGTGDSIATVDSAGSVGTWTALDIAAFGRPVVAYSDFTGSSLNVAWCIKPSCVNPSYPTFTVNTTSDTVDVNHGNGICADAGANCSLRAAIQEANALAGLQAVQLAGGTTALSIAGTSEDAAATGDLDITDDITLFGVGGAPFIIVDANSIDRVFHVRSGAFADFSGFTITDGDTASGQDGGGILVDGSGSTAQLSSMRVNGNVATSGNAGGIGNSGGTVTLQRVTVSNNVADISAGGIGAGSAATTTIDSSTISGNTADLNAGGIGQQSASSTMTLNNVTVGENIADADGNSTGFGGGLAHDSLGTFTVRNSIIARNVNTLPGAPDCVGTITSATYNLIGNNSLCTYSSSTGDQVGTGATPIDPLYGRLRFNTNVSAEVTETHAISVISPAIDAGNPATPGSGGNACLGYAQNQNLVSGRLIDGNSDLVDRCDIGAYEREGAVEEPCTPPGTGYCDTYSFDVALTVDLGGPTACTAAGDLRAERAPEGNFDADGFQDSYVEITYLDGYVDCPGDFFLGSSIPNEGYIEEQVNTTSGLDFPANGTFTVCLTIASHPYGDLHNCPNDFLPQNKTPLVFSCKIFSLSSFDCDINADSNFYDDSDTLIATVEEADAELDRISTISAIGGDTSLPDEGGGNGALQESDGAGWQATTVGWVAAASLVLALALAAALWRAGGRRFG